MKVLITGANGLLGSKLCEFFRNEGHQVVRMLRGNPERNTSTELYWDPVAGKIDVSSLEGMDAVVHLVGETVAQRWTDDAKQKIIQSRIKSTDLLCRSLAQLKKRPEVLIAGSAIGYYGDRGQLSVTEEASVGSGFLADLCVKWETATKPATEAGIRTINMRTGVVLSKEGGALSKMLTPFQMGAGGILGDGKQYMSWIAMPDVLNAVKFMIENKNLSGPVNLVASNPVTNQDFTKALGKVLHRPTICPVPAPVVKLLMGQMADEMLLSGAKVLPSKLESAGYKFKYPFIEDGLREAVSH